MNDACVNHSVQTILNCTIMQCIECVFCIVFTHKEFMKWFRPVISCHLWSWIIKFYRQILKVLRSPWKMNTFLEDTLQFEWHFLTPKGLSFHLNSEVTAWPESNIFYWRRFLGKFVLTNVYVCTCISSKRDNSSILVISAF